MQPSLIKKRYTDKYFALPAIIWVAVTTQVPFLLTIIFSLLKWRMNRPDLGIRFNWLNNYQYYLWGNGRVEFWTITWQTIELTLISLVACTLFGFLVALLLDHDIPGINVVRTLILGPFFVMSTASGVIWKVTILNTTFGWYGYICKLLGIVPVDFISYYSLPLISFLFVWQWMPFFVLVILAGLQGISQEVLESARIDGCNWGVLTFKIKLPMILNHMQVAIMLGMIFIVKEFGLILVTTAGGPGTRSYTLPFNVYKLVFRANDVGRAATVAVITVMITLLAVQLLYRAIKKRRAMYD
jgi:sorbitol/mannitol transport system permease protein